MASRYPKRGEWVEVDTHFGPRRFGTVLGKTRSKIHDLDVFGVRVLLRDGTMGLVHPDNLMPYFEPWRNDA